MMPKLRHYSHGIGVALLLIAVLFNPTASAQVAPSLEASSLRGQLMQQAQRQAAQRALAGTDLALEGAIDPDAYIVGPGDEFLITTGGSMAQEARATVSAEGMLLIPEAGRFEVAGLTLSETRTLVSASLQRLYRNVPAEIALVQPRRFYVHVSGSVRIPGRHVVGPVARVEDAIVKAMDGENPLLVFRIEQMMAQRYREVSSALPALRNIEVRHRDGSVSRIDLRRYYATGDQEANPYLRDGDVVHVPLFDLRRSAVYVEGGGTVTGAYDLRPDDTAASLLAAAAGTTSLDDIGPIRVVSADGRTAYSVSPELNPDAQSQLQSIHLRAGDRIIIQRAAPHAGTAEVLGRALFPGTYPIVIGETTAQDLIEQAGGFLDDALLSAAYVDRPGPAHDRRAAFDTPSPLELAAVHGPTQREPTPIEIELAREEESFRSLRLADLGFAERQYLLRELRGFSRLMINLDREDGGSLTLQDGDRLVIPKDPGGVVVFGQVQSGGVVPHSPGRDANFYIDQVGGRTQGAADTYVRRAGSGQLMPARQVNEISHGDEVFVSRRQLADSDRIEQLRLQEEQVRAQRRQHLVQIGAAVLSSTTAIVTALIFRR